MLNLKQIVNETKMVKDRLSTRGFDTSLIDEVIGLAKKRSGLMTELQKYQSTRNDLSTEIGTKKKQNLNIKSLVTKVNSLKTKIDKTSEKLDQLNQQLNIKLLLIPNLPSKEVPLGNDERDNKVIKEYSKLGRGLVKDVLSHDQIALKLNLVDFERTVKISGSRFWSYRGIGAKLLRALIDFMLDEHIKQGYLEINPPLIVNSEAPFGVGQLPKFEDDLFKLKQREAYLISTAEVPLTAFYSNEIVNLLGPIKLTAYTPCFRQEAGSGGKDTKGLIRGHQFHKVEMVKIVNHQDAKHQYELTLQDAQNILEKLELPYRTVQLCSGDLGFAASQTIDLEVWMPSQNCYREISSVSLFNEFQSRRLMIRYKDDKGDNQYAITINGSGLAIDRTIAAILENYQNKDGSVTIPKVLLPYFNKLKVIK